jgi:hypothetical protein
MTFEGCPPVIRHGNPNERPSQPSSAWSCVLLTTAMVSAFPAFAVVGYWRSGYSGLGASAVAGGVCWMAALMSLLLMCVLRGSPYLLHAFLLGMLFRMGLPLAVGVALSRSGSPLADAGIFGMMVVYYLLGLFVETLLSVRLVPSSARRIEKVS